MTRAFLLIVPVLLLIHLPLHLCAIERKPRGHPLVVIHQLLVLVLQ